MFFSLLLVLTSRCSGQIGRNVVSKTHFGGFGDEEVDEDEDEEGVHILIHPSAAGAYFFLACEEENQGRSYG